MNDKISLALGLLIGRKLEAAQLGKQDEVPNNPELTVLRDTWDFAYNGTFGHHSELPLVEGETYIVTTNSGTFTTICKRADAVFGSDYYLYLGNCNEIITADYVFDNSHDTFGFAEYYIKANSNVIFWVFSSATAKDYNRGGTFIISKPGSNEVIASLTDGVLYIEKAPATLDGTTLEV